MGKPNNHFFAAKYQGKYWELINANQHKLMRGWFLTPLNIYNDYFSLLNGK